MEKSFDFDALLQKHEKKHKSKPTQFVSVAGGVRKRLESNIRCRKSNRLTIFDSIRNLPKCDSPKKNPDPFTKEEHRRMQLERWKEEKEKKKKLAAAQKKKPFVAGVAHAPLKYVPPPPLPKAVPSTSGRVTRSQAAKTISAKSKTQSFAPKNAMFKAPEIKSTAKVPTLAPLSKVKKNKETFTFDPILPSTLVNSKTEPGHGKSKKNVTDKVITQVERKSQRGKVSKVENSRSKDKISHVLQGSKFKVSSPDNTLQSSFENIPKSESNSEEKLRSPKSPVEVPLTPDQIVEEAKKNSPFVTLSRGKANARREVKKKIDEGLLDEDASDVDSVDHFRRQLNSEIKRMTEMCETWEKISEQMVLPETVQEAVLGAVGQARLLMSHKLQQFAALVARCERPEPGQALVTPADLHGFWDMVFMQVENVDVRFKKLEEMRARNWVEEAVVVPRRKAAPKAKSQAKPVAASRLRDVIAAARKAKKQDNQPQEVQEVPLEAPAQPAKTFEAGFFCVRSPVRSPASNAPPATLATPARTVRSSLLKTVLSSEAKKSATKNATSLAMLRASLIGKNVENNSPTVEPLNPVTPINLHATPGRSILKPLNVPSGKKSIKVVLFDDTDVEALDTSRQDAECDNRTNRVAKLQDVTVDTGDNINDVAKEKEQKENKPRKKSLIRQDAIKDTSPMMTRSRRKSMSTPAIVPDMEENTPKRTSRKKKALKEVEVNIVEGKNYTPKRSSRRKSDVQGA